jgi:hypothetical protein
MQMAGGLQDLAFRAEIDVALPVEAEILAREGAVLALALVPHRDVRRDALPHQPA